MSREEILRYLQNPLLIGIAAALAVILIGLVLISIFRSRKRKSASEETFRTELVAMERENQFAAAAERVQFLKNSDEVIREVARLFREHLSMPVLALYVGKAGEPMLGNILKGEGQEEQGADSAALLPSRLPVPPSVEQQQPRVTGLASLSGSSGITSNEETTRSPLISSKVALLPWRGPFDWTGIIVALANDSVTTESLSRYREPLARLSDRLAVALEIEGGPTTAGLPAGQESRQTQFFRALISALDEPSPLISIAREVATLMGADSAAIWRREPSSSMVRMAAASGLKSAEFLPLPVGQGFAGSIVASGKALAIEDAPSDSRCLFPREARESGITSYIGVPLMAEGETLGVMEAHYRSPHRWTRGEIEVMQSIGPVIGEVLQSTDARGNRLKVESAYLGLSEALQRLRSRDEILEAAVEVLGHALGVSRAVVVEVNERGEPQPIRYEYRMPEARSAAGARLSPQIFGRLSAAAPGGEPVEIVDSQSGSLLDSETLKTLEVQSELALPIRIEGQVRAFIHLHQSDRVREWHRDEVEFAARVTRQLALSLANISTLEAAFMGKADMDSRFEQNEQRIGELERALQDARAKESQWRALIEKSQAGEAEARGALASARRAEAELRQECDRLRENESRLRGSGQQLLEINRLKSEFIVNAGRELEASLQTLMGNAELLRLGALGVLTAEQLQSIRAIYADARRMKADIDMLIEYGSTRSRRLEQGDYSE